MTLNPKLQTKAQDYKIADIGLAEWGKKEIEIAFKAEMPGLLSFFYATREYIILLYLLWFNFCSFFS